MGLACHLHNVTPNLYSSAQHIPISERHGWLRQTPFSESYDDNDDRTPSPDPPSVQPGEKRPRSDDSDCETEEVAHKAHKINEKSGRPKARDYDDVAKEIILQAATIYHCLLSTENGFPELAVETELVKVAWEDTNKASGMPTLALTPDIAKIVSRFL